MSRVGFTAAVAICVLLGSPTHAQRMEVSTQTIKNGVILDAGSGPKRFVCVENVVTHHLTVSGRALITKGKYLTISFEGADNRLSLEAHDQVRPLDRNQVRLTCVKNAIQSQVGFDVEVNEQP